MRSAPDIIADAVERALREVLGTNDKFAAIIRPSVRPQYGDYQANGILPEAKFRKLNASSLAQQIAAKVSPELNGICDRIEPLGPGFINFYLKRSFVSERISAIAVDERLGVPVVVKPKTVVIDFSSPNVAKPMHVGHIRSTILGDCLARVMRFLGHHVITDNHIGDWGTQFGKLLVGWKKYLDRDALLRDPLGEMERLYRIERSLGRKLKLEDNTAEFSEEARRELVKLQSGDEENSRHWREMIALSQKQFDEIYGRLGVKFDHTLGESFYNQWLMEIVSELRSKRIARESEGAQVVFFDEIPELKESPAIVQKRDGGFNYATTDLATLRYRLQTWHPDEIVYITDARQQLHFKQVFAIFRRWHPEVDVKLTHIWFGTILGEDGKPFKTRAGDTIKLSDLLDEAEERARAVVREKNPELPADVCQQIARAVGIGAIKYADLSQNRTTDYVFSWPKMLAMNGNTAPYMQYAYVRVQSIFRKAGDLKSDSASITLEQLHEADLAAAVKAGVTPITLEHAVELDLAKHILRFSETLQAVADDDKPNWLTSYLYDLANKFSSFYENCPVLQSPEPTRSSRLVLCRLTADVIKSGLNLLGIDVIEQM